VEQIDISIIINAYRNVLLICTLIIQIILAEIAAAYVKHVMAQMLRNA